MALRCLGSLDSKMQTRARGKANKYSENVLTQTFPVQGVFNRLDF